MNMFKKHQVIIFLVIIFLVLTTCITVTLVRDSHRWTEPFPPETGWHWNPGVYPQDANYPGWVKDEDPYITVKVTRKDGSSYTLLLPKNDSNHDTMVRDK
jgi:hypothetical protein